MDTSENMLKILANENVETEEDRTQYQIDTVVAVKRYLLENRPSGGRFSESEKPTHKSEAGAREISDFLGTKNWSKSRVANLLKLHNDLHADKNKGDKRQSLLAEKVFSVYIDI
ncbi:MAG: hypothetical protein IID16_04365 [Candidatus Marinimicrobia bacterium]|nr:hypothetical protein [Candidatus Neomarinimicrobiota bacterium]